MSWKEKERELSFQDLFLSSLHCHMRLYTMGNTIHPHFIRSSSAATDPAAQVPYAFSYRFLKGERLREDIGVHKKALDMMCKTLAPSPPKVRTGQVRHSHDLVSLLIQRRRARSDIAVTPAAGWQSSWNCLLKRERRPDEITNEGDCSCTSSCLLKGVFDA